MSTLTRPAGPLSPRVYWTRRLVLVVLVLALVYALARLVGSFGSDGGSPDARQAAAPATTSSAPSPSGAPTPAPTTTAPASSAAPTERPTRVPLVAPTGSCPDDDIVVTPSVRAPARAGSAVVLVMDLTTKVSPACTWNLSPTTFAVKVSDDSGDVWSSQECEEALGGQQLTLRKDRPARVAVAWNGQRSDDECSRTTRWAEPGPYELTAAAFGSEPSRRVFVLAGAATPTVTTTPEPRKSESPDPEPSAKPSAEPSASPER